MFNFDYIYAALILHDSVKPGFEEVEKLHTNLLHPKYAVQLIKDCFKVNSCELTEDVINDICRLIESHMGQWNTNYEKEVILPKPVQEDEKLVHLCDYLAAKKFLEVIF